MEITMTVGQIAKELGVSRQAVYQKIRLDKQLQADLQPFTVKQGNKTLYTAEGQKRLIEAFSGRDSVKTEKKTNSNSQQQLIDLLREQLEVKDKQIEQLSERLKEVTTALQAAQALHGMEHSPKAIAVDAVAADQPGERPQPERTQDQARKQMQRTAPERVAPSGKRLGLIERIKKRLI